MKSGISDEQAVRLLFEVFDLLLEGPGNPVVELGQSKLDNKASYKNEAKSNKQLG